MILVNDGTLLEKFFLLFKVLLKTKKKNSEDILQIA